MVTASRLWKTGTHMKRHLAGRDLTTDIKAAPHGIDVLDRYPPGGRVCERGCHGNTCPRLVIPDYIQSAHAAASSPPDDRPFPDRFHDIATVFTLLYLATGIKTFETTAFHCLGGGCPVYDRFHPDGTLHVVAQLPRKNRFGRSGSNSRSLRSYADLSGCVCLACHGAGCDAYRQRSQVYLYRSCALTVPSCNRHRVVWRAVDFPNGKKRECPVHT